LIEVDTAMNPMLLRNILLRILLILGCTLALSAARAEEPRQIGWEHLAPRLSPADNPFASLAPEYLEALVDVAAFRDRRARGVAVSASEIASERAASAKLAKAGIDTDKLLARRDELAAKQRALANAIDASLDGKLVRIPGYLLPLEFSGTRVTEFLLVPWVGACIHTPPPPRNQIVHVKSTKPFEMSGMFDAVWVTGRMTASGSRKSVHIVDGSTEVDVGYSLNANLVARYKE
jgi:uncharacterized protein